MSKRNIEIGDQEVVSSEPKKRKVDCSSPSPEWTHDNYTVGWICASPQERTAATAMLDQRHGHLSKPPNDPNLYTLGSVGMHSVVIACPPKGKNGTNSAATVATWMVSTFPSVKFGLMVGIGGGIPPKVRLSDVVVSTPVGNFSGVVQWNFDKTKEGGSFRQTRSLNKPPNSLLTALTKLETEHELTGSKIPDYLEVLKEKWPRLAPNDRKCNSLKDILFRADYGHVSKTTMDFGDILDIDGDKQEESCRFCDKTMVVNRKPRDTRVHYGLIASGNHVIKDATERDKLNQDLGGHVLCVEMEAAGLMNNFPSIVIRGICDYADSHKNEDWQEHAAAVAAAFAKELLGYVQSSDVDGERTAKDILGPVLEAPVEIKEDATKTRAKFVKKEDMGILNWLTDINYGPQQSDYRRLRQPRTGQWLLDSTQYKAWVETEGQTLFCPGVPGAGKTILTSIVIEELAARFRNHERIRVVYLYCNFKRQDEQRAEDLLASLLKQLARGRPSLLGDVRSLHNKHRGKGTRPSSDEISRALYSVAARYSRVFIIVDALDECPVLDGCRTRFLAEILNLQAKRGVNIFATSRPVPEITEKFEGSMSLRIRATEKDVRKYIDGHWSQLPAFVKQNPDLQEEIKMEIVKAIDGSFLLAQLHLNSLRGKMSPKAIRTALKRLPMGSGAYNRAYDDAMERIEGQLAGQKELAKRVLGWIACAKRQLTTSELRHALAVEVGESELDKENLPQIEDIVSVCAGLVTVDKESSIIRFVHHTAQDYLVQLQERLFPNAETDITTICVTYLAFSTFQSGFCASDKELKKRLHQNPFYDYAARNWGHHARAASAEVEQLILDFLASEAKMSASSQAMVASRPYFSSGVPRQMSAAHFAAYFGLKKTMTALLKNGHDPNLTDTYDQTPLWSAVANGHEVVAELLLKNGAQPDFMNKSGRTPLSIAAERGDEAAVKLLLSKEVNPDSKNNDGRTPLSFAVEKGDEAVVKLLLEKGADPDSHDVDGLTPLSFALEKGNKAVINLLLKKGVNLDSKNNVGRTLLSLAAGNGNEAVVNLLLAKDGVDPDSKDRNNRTPLSFAAEKGTEETVKLLLKKGVDPDLKGRNGRTPLSFAAEREDTEVARLLLARHGVNPDSKDGNNRTPLSYAAEKGSEEIVKLLLEKGVDPDMKDSNGWTPLLFAVRRGNTDAVGLLLARHGVDPESKNINGRTPLSFAAEKGTEEIVKLLLERGVDPDLEDKNGRTPLSFAARRGNREAARLLLAKEGIDVDSKDENNRTPLLWAVSENKQWKKARALVKLLLEAGANPDSKDKDGRTPLSFAVELWNEAAVTLLLEKDIELDSTDNNGRAPLSFAVEKGNDTAVELLLTRGANPDSKDNDGRTPLSRAADGHQSIAKLLLEWHRHRAKDQFPADTSASFSSSTGEVKQSPGDGSPEHTNG